MGCNPSKILATKDLSRKISTHHVVSLISTTYGVLSLEKNERGGVENGACVSKVAKVFHIHSSLFTPPSKKRVIKEEPSEIINIWESMKDLSDETPIWSPATRPPKSQTPEITNSSKKQKSRLLGKENHSRRGVSSRILSPFSSSVNRQPRKLAGSRLSMSPWFDPELVACFERELNEGREKIEKLDSTIHETLETFEERCPPRGENDLVFYYTSLEVIRRTFEDCKTVRNTIEAYGVKMVERDVFMDSGFREELKVLMPGKEKVKLPALFVKGRLIGGAEEVMKLEDEGKLGLLLDGIPKKETMGCGVCGGVRFVLCRVCNVRAKVLDEEEKVKCGYCNENGLIHCPLCS